MNLGEHVFLLGVNYFKKELEDIFENFFEIAQLFVNILCLKMQVLKLIDLVKFRTAQILYKARNNTFPLGIQKLFIEREGK